MNSFGNLVTNLFALALGLGSLKLAGEGLWAGAIGGLGGSAADVRFTAHPLGFVLLVAAWTAFGVFLVRFGWRGFTRPGETDGEDDHDEEEEERCEVPVPQPRSAPVLCPPNGVQAAPTPPFVATARPAAMLPEPLTLYTSRAWAVVVLLLATVVVLGAGYACFGLSHFLTTQGAGLLFAPALLGYVMVAWKCVRDFFWHGPALVLDHFGILDYRHSGRSIPWTDVDAVRLHASTSSTSLVLRFRDLALARRHFGSLNMLSALMNRIFYKGYEGRVFLTGLSFKRAPLLQVAQAFVWHARR